MLKTSKKGNAAYQDVQGLYTHVFDPNERRRLALAEVDKSPFGWYHVRMIVVTGIGFFTDAYSLFAINLTTTMFGMVYWHTSNGGKIPHDADIAIKVATSGGTVLGQALFGYLADYLGRKRMYGIELLIIVSATLAQSLCAPSQAISFVGILVFWRVLMGIGVGGDYPLSAVITSEFANTKSRGGMVSAVFAMQGLGQFAAAMLTLVVTVAFRNELEGVISTADCDLQCQVTVDKMWRIILGFGGIPGWFALYYRLTIPETPRYTFDVLHDIEKASADARRFRSGQKGEAKTDELRQAQVRKEIKMTYRTSKPTPWEATKYFCKRRNALRLFGTAGSWFFLDIAFYGLGLNSGSILTTIGYASTENVYRMLYNASVGQLILVCAGAIPGYWLTVFTVDKLGRKLIQITGFCVLTLIFAIIGFAFDRLSQGVLTALYILAQLFFNWGPNATTFLMPAELFPTRHRCTAHGLSAAAGKLGAIIAQVAFAPLVDRGGTAENPHPWLNRVMQIFALFMFCGIGTSLLLPETKRKTLEELAGEGKNGESGVFEMRFVEGFWRRGDNGTEREDDISRRGEDGGWWSGWGRVKGWLRLR